MVYILRREFRFYPADAHGLELQHHHGAGGVLGQRLVNLQADLAAGLHGTFQQVRSN